MPTARKMFAKNWARSFAADVLQIARFIKGAKARMPNRLLATVLTLGWRIDKVCNGLFSEVERRWPAFFVSIWRGTVVVRVK